MCFVNLVLNGVTIQINFKGYSLFKEIRLSDPYKIFINCINDMNKILSFVFYA